MSSYLQRLFQHSPRAGGAEPGPLSCYRVRRQTPRFRRHARALTDFRLGREREGWPLRHFARVLPGMLINIPRA
jgi:hypothetical protein